MLRGLRIRPICVTILHAIGNEVIGAASSSQQGVGSACDASGMLASPIPIT